MAIVALDQPFPYEARSFGDLLELKIGGTVLYTLHFTGDRTAGHHGQDIDLGVFLTLFPCYFSGEKETSHGRSYQGCEAKVERTVSRIVSLHQFDLYS